MFYEIKHLNVIDTWATYFVVFTMCVDILVLFLSCINLFPIDKKWKINIKYYINKINGIFNIVIKNIKYSVYFVYAVNKILIV